MASIEFEIKKHLTALVGLPLCISRRAADVLVLHFGTIREVDTGGSKAGKRVDKKGSVGDFSLHIQCPWRIEKSDGIITGRGDLYISAETGEYFDDAVDDNSFYKQGKSLQDKKVGELLQGIDPITGSYMNITNFLVVESVTADSFGGATLYLSGDYRLVIFPSSSKGEHWRLFQAATNEKHFVMSHSQVEFE
jgi:hypothetical protein